MKGRLSPDEQLRILRKIWGRNRTGYVYLPWIEGQSKNKEQRRRNYHEGKAFVWPDETGEILEHLSKHQGDDLYFAPNVFKGKRRVQELALPETVLYADLDPVDPRTLSEKPTIAWESSPNRYQAVWCMEDELGGASMGGGLNHRLTAAIGADPSGWDTTQLLRVPGRPNYKPEYTDADEPNGVMGKGLLWNEPRVYAWDEFKELPEVGSITTSALEHVDEDVLASIDRHEVYARVRLKLPQRVREMIRLRMLPEGTDRSNALWDMSRALADAGCSVLEIVAILRPTVWNKFAGRSDEINRLMMQAQKAIAQKSDDLEVIEEEPTQKPNVTWLSEIVSKPIPRPQWLIKDVWTKNGCGFISGAPKSYKSWMALDMAVSVSTGSPWLGEFAVHSPAPVLYLQEEDGLQLVMDRLQIITEAKAPERFWGGQITVSDDSSGAGALGVHRLTWSPAEAPMPIAMHVQTGFIASDPGWQGWLDEVIEEHKFGMVLIDTLGTTAGDIDTDKSGELMNKMLKPLKVLAQKHNTAVCVVHHNKKAAGAGRAGNDMLGSVALHAWVDCAIYARSKDIHGEVSIERESKLAQDLSFRIKIPHMHQDYRTGDRVLWEPQFIIDGLEAEPTHHAEQSDSRSSDRPPAGHLMAQKVKAMGAGKWHSLDKICAITDKSHAEAVKQLTAGVESGLLAEKDGLYCFPRA